MTTPTTGQSLLDRITAVLACFDEDFVIEGRHPFRCGPASASRAIRKPATRPSGLLQSAGLALSRAKAAGRGSFWHFEAGMEASLAERQAIALDLREAIALDQLDVHYQPLVGALSGFAEGFEALARWRHPTRGLRITRRLHSDRRGVRAHRRDRRLCAQAHPLRMRDAGRRTCPSPSTCRHASSRNSISSTSCRMRRASTSTFAASNSRSPRRFCWGTTHRCSTA